MKYIRMSITVPENIRDEMRAVGENCNWSEVASAAFAEHLDEIKRSRAIDALSQLPAGKLVHAIQIISTLRDE